ncbi:hypothetical protein K458DRAFT_8856 [Lentithecium fluviatile CBS 122367]|uniref:Uncharacterized protein n=1 Tax=Lentithecium fluviatile CBS 122367 TaxID=1168545 RepID=A0A6G1JN85_9PLEO|nr:hypothetical protein K458DRAFT_8856 [Lentithecium fluviatile CBS 122367]
MSGYVWSRKCRRPNLTASSLPQQPLSHRRSLVAICFDFTTSILSSFALRTFIFCMASCSFRNIPVNTPMPSASVCYLERAHRRSSGSKWAKSFQMDQRIFSCKSHMCPPYPAAKTV